MEGDEKSCDGADEKDTAGLPAAKRARCAAEQPLHVSQRPLSVSNPIRRIDGPEAAREAFDQAYASERGSPLIFSGCMGDWPLLSMGQGAISELLAEERVAAIRMHYADAEAEQPSYSSRETLAFSELAEKLFQPDREEYWYLQWRGLPTPLQLEALQREARGEEVSEIDSSGTVRFASPGLLSFMQSMRVPHFMEHCEVRQRNLWLGRIRSSQCHFDGMDNLICVAKGKKLVSLYSPWELHRLYPRSNKLLPIESRFGSVRRGLQLPGEFPLLSRVHEVHGEVCAGECLYIPNGWWHEVRTPTPALAVNMWFVPSKRSRYRPTIMYLSAGESYLSFFGAAHGTPQHQCAS